MLEASICPLLSLQIKSVDDDEHCENTAYSFRWNIHSTIQNAQYL